VLERASLLCFTGRRLPGQLRPEGGEVLPGFEVIQRLYRPLHLRHGAVAVLQRAPGEVGDQQDGQDCQLPSMLERFNALATLVLGSQGR